jgi:hypothetical protein
MWRGLHGAPQRMQQCVQTEVWKCIRLLFVGNDATGRRMNLFETICNAKSAYCSNVGRPRTMFNEISSRSKLAASNILEELIYATEVSLNSSERDAAAIVNE